MKIFEIRILAREYWLKVQFLLTETPWTILLLNIIIVIKRMSYTPVLGPRISFSSIKITL